MKFSVLASGSGGNACYVETETASILVDAGLSCREIERRLQSVGVEAGRLDALIITHEHSDHIKGAGPVARRFGLPIYTNRRTLEKGVKTLGPLAQTVIIQNGEPFSINGLTVHPFTKCHDAADPFGLVISSGDKRIGLATDLGRSTNLVENVLRECQALVMEFNYDPAMLEDGPYPLDIKRRIKGAEGHLSNIQGAELLRSVYHEGLDCVVIAHLSKINNHPEKAYSAALKALHSCCSLERVKIVISEQDEPIPMIEV